MHNIERNGVFYEVVKGLVTGRVLTENGQSVAFAPDLKGVNAGDLTARLDKLDVGHKFVGAAYVYAAQLRGAPVPG